MTATKQSILDAALDLFSTNGFEATSMGQIADAVGIRKSSLYSHFAGKQEILDTLIAIMSEEFNKNSVFSQKIDGAKTTSADALVQSVKEQIRYVLHDSRIRKVRKFLTIEQYRNPQIAALQTKHVYTDILNYNRAIMQRLIGNSVLADSDPEIMAAQFAFPISAWLYLCDREPEREEEVMQLLERHVLQFFKIYKK